jgi:Tfp pilus assembly protein PilZ
VIASVTPPTMREVERSEEPKSAHRAESKERASAKPKVSPGSVKPGLVADAVKAAGKAPASVKAKEKAKEPPQVEQPPRVPPSRSPASQEGGLPRLDALLGANSASNFYRGFDDDDVVSHGGVFVATYNSPNLGQRIALRVSFPDGHEFTTRGVVKWRRLAAPDGSHPHDVPPGFGVSLEDVSEQARGLIARYVSNREPLFHDDD